MRRFMARVVASYVAEFYEKPCSPKGFPLRVMPALQLCLRSWKGKQGKLYYFTIVSIPKEISICLASQTKLQMSTLFPSTPRMVNVCELDNRILPSYFSAEQVGPPFEEKPHTAVHRTLSFETHDDSKLSFCLDSCFWADFYSGTYCQKGRQLVSSLLK